MVLDSEVRIGKGQLLDPRGCTNQRVSLVCEIGHIGDADQLGHVICRPKQLQGFMTGSEYFLIRFKIMYCMKVGAITFPNFKPIERVMMLPTSLPSESAPGSRLFDVGFIQDDVYPMRLNRGN